MLFEGLQLKGDCCSGDLESPCHVRRPRADSTVFVVGDRQKIVGDGVSDLILLESLPQSLVLTHGYIVGRGQTGVNELVDAVVGFRRTVWA